VLVKMEHLVPLGPVTLAPRKDLYRSSRRLARCRRVTVADQAVLEPDFAMRAVSGLSGRCRLVEIGMGAMGPPKADRSVTF
jgi:hypothetical protein